MNEENKTKKPLLQDNANLKKLIQDAEQCVEEGGGEEREKEKPLPVKFGKKPLVNDPEFLSSITASSSSQKNSISYAAFGIILLIGGIVFLLFLHANQFNKSMGTIYSAKAGPAGDRARTPGLQGSAIYKATQHSSGAARVGIFKKPSDYNLAIPQRPSPKKIVYDDESSTAATVPPASPEEPIAKPSLNLSVVPKDYLLVREESNGARVYVSPDSEIYVLNPESNNLDRIVRRHAP